MKWIEKTSDKLSQAFKSKRILKPFYALFEAADSFLLTPKTLTSNGSHIRDHVDMKRIMITVMIALLPPTLFGIWNIGYQHFAAVGIYANFWHTVWYGIARWFPIILTVYVSGLVVEIIFAQRRGHSVAEGFFVTGMILPLIVPPEIPLWILSIATIFATLFAKEVYGGTGYNFLNPALVARAFIFFAYPGVISGDGVWIAGKPDAFSGATPLANIAGSAASSLPGTSDMFVGIIPGCIGETSKIAIILGALLLIYTRVASFRTMISVIVGGLVTGSIFNLIGSTALMQVPAWEHLLMGGFLFGAVFMATDPVTSPHTGTGQIIYGLLVGALAIFIRVVNRGYPEGMMLAILLMNVFSSLIDHLAIQRNIKKRLARSSRARACACVRAKPGRC